MIRIGLPGRIAQLLRAGGTHWSFIEANMEAQIQAGETTLEDYEKWFAQTDLDDSWKDYVAWKAEHPDEPVPPHVNRVPPPFVIDYQRMDLVRVPDLIDHRRRPVPIPDYVIQNMIDHGTGVMAREMVDENLADIERYEARHGKREGTL